MSNSDPQQITSNNEEYVRQWFELSGFTSVRLDSKDGKRGKNADWKFSKQDLNVICEVKTIFSGGQSGLTEEQWQRNRLQEKKKLDQHIASVPKGEKLLATKDYLDWINGKTPYLNQIIRKEGVEGAKGTYKDFKKVLKNDLQNDKDIMSLPFDISISISGLYVPNQAQYTDFFDWLKGFVIWANKNRDQGRFYPPHAYKFEADDRTIDGHFIYGAEAFVQIWGPTSYPSLDVGFMNGGTPYNEDKITSTIEDAVEQLRASKKNGHNLENAKSIIAFWSDSSSLSFSMLLYMDMIGAQLKESPKRYSLFDWSFSKYRDLSGIALFELKPPEGANFWEISEFENLTPMAYLITNPFLPEDEITLKSTINETYCAFLKGIGSDPLA